MTKNIVIYTDGSCHHKSRIGGWGATMNVHGVKIETSGCATNTTVNRMEVYAAIRALRLIKTPSKIILYTDSQYLCRGADEHIWRWAESNFKQGHLKNLDLWQQIYKLNKRHRITWLWVRGHSGNKGNDRADKLAGDAYRKLKRKLEKENE